MLSVIVPVWNQVEYTRTCLMSLQENTNGEHEVLVVDNGSTDGSVDILGEEFSDYPSLRFLRNEQNRGFPVACNQGVEMSRGNIICLLNNDTIVPRWWNVFLEKSLSSIDVVGPVSNYVAGMQLRKIPEYGNYTELMEQARLLMEQGTGELVETRWVIGFCMMFRREVWERVGTFDGETFGYGNSEDLDWCYRAVGLGYRIGFTPDVYVHHFGSVTCNRLSTPYRKLLLENGRKLLRKWGVAESEFRQEI